MPLWTWVWKHTDSLVKKKVLDTANGKEGHPDIFMEHETTHHLISLKKGQL